MQKEEKEAGGEADIYQAIMWHVAIKEAAKISTTTPYSVATRGFAALGVGAGTSHWDHYSIHEVRLKSISPTS